MDLVGETRMTKEQKFQQQLVAHLEKRLAENPDSKTLAAMLKRAIAQSEKISRLTPST